MNVSFRKKPVRVKKIEDLSRYAQGETSQLGRSFGTIDLVNEHLKAEFNVGYSSTSSLTENHLQSGEFSFNKLGARGGLNGRWKSARYWAVYSFSGSQFRTSDQPTPQDRTGLKMGGSWDLGIMEPKVELRRFYDNVAGNPLKPRTTVSQADFSLTLKEPDLPRLVLSYRRQGKVTSERPGSSVSHDVLTDRLRAKLSYGGSYWQGYLQSRYDVVQDLALEEAGHGTVRYFLGGSYQPVESLRISPRIGFTRTRNHSDSTGAATLSASLRSLYQPLSDLTVTPRFSVKQVSPRSDTPHTTRLHAQFTGSQATPSFDLSFSGAYTGTRNSIQTLKTHRIDLGLELRTDIPAFLRLPHREQSVRIKLAHHHFVDTIHRSHNSSGGSAFFMLHLTP